MECKCCVFNIQGITYLSQCNECVKQKKTISITKLTQVEYKFKWYELHIKIIRDYPEIRLGVEIYCMISICIWFICAFLDYTQIVNFKQYNLISNIISGFLMLSVIFIFGYIDAINKLANDKKFILADYHID